MLEVEPSIFPSFFSAAAPIARAEMLGYEPFRSLSPWQVWGRVLLSWLFCLCVAIDDDCFHSLRSPHDRWF
mgnify:CR=1 FL=1